MTDKVDNELSAMWQFFFGKKQKGPVVRVAEWLPGCGIYHQNRPDADPLSILPGDTIRTWTAEELAKVDHEIIEPPPPNYDELAKQIRAEAGLKPRDKSAFDVLFPKRKGR